MFHFITAVFVAAAIFFSMWGYEMLQPEGAQKWIFMGGFAAIPLILWILKRALIPPKRKESREKSE